MLHNLDWSAECLFAAITIGAGRIEKCFKHISELSEHQD